MNGWTPRLVLGPSFRISRSWLRYDHLGLTAMLDEVQVVFFNTRR